MENSLAPHSVGRSTSSPSEVRSSSKHHVFFLSSQVGVDASEYYYRFVPAEQ